MWAGPPRERAPVPPSWSLHVFLKSLRQAQGGPCIPTRAPHREAPARHVKHRETERVTRTHSRVQTTIWGDVHRLRVWWGCTRVSSPRAPQMKGHELHHPHGLERDGQFCAAENQLGADPTFSPRLRRPPESRPRSCCRDPAHPTREELPEFAAQASCMWKNCCGT